MRDARSKLIQFKIFNRLYWTPVKMQRTGLSDSTLCWKCKSDNGNLVHMLFTCSTLQPYWKKVIEEINTILDTNLQLTPTLCILNKLNPAKGISSEKVSWIKIALTTAKRLILKYWKSNEPPTFMEWFITLSETASFERLIYKINGKNIFFNKIWEVFLKKID